MSQRVSMEHFPNKFRVNIDSNPNLVCLGSILDESDSMSFPFVKGGLRGISNIFSLKSHPPPFEKKVEIIRSDLCQDKPDSGYYKYEHKIYQVITYPKFCQAFKGIDQSITIH